MTFPVSQMSRANLFELCHGEEKLHVSELYCNKGWEDNLFSSLPSFCFLYLAGKPKLVCKYICNIWRQERRECWTNMDIFEP